MANNTGKKYGGRTPGVPNKLTNDVRLMFSELLNENFDKLKEDISQLEPKDRVRALIDISKFVIPSLKAIEVEYTNENDFNIKPIVVQIVSSDERVEN